MPNNKRIAIVLSGHIRNFSQNYNSFKRYVLEPLNYPDIFLSSYTTFGWRSEGNVIQIGKNVNNFKGFDHFSGQINQQEIIDLLKPKVYIFDNFLDLEEEFNTQALRIQPNCKHPKDRSWNTVSQNFKIHQCNELKKSEELKGNFKYDIVIRTRPDMVYFNKILNDNMIKLIEDDWLITPSNHSYNKASDIAALGNSKIMDVYSEIYLHLDRMNESGINMSPHDLFKYFWNEQFPNKWKAIQFPFEINRCRQQCVDQFVCVECDPIKTINSGIKS